MRIFPRFLLVALALGVACPGVFAQHAGDDLDLPSLLSLFSAHALPSDGVRLNWTLEKQSPTIQVFRIYRGYEDAGNFELAAEVPSRGVSGGLDYTYTDTTAQPGVSYFFKLAAAGPRTESVFPVVISATAQLAQTESSELEKIPVMILPGDRLALYVRRPGRVTLQVVTPPAKALVDDTLRPGIYEFTLSRDKPVMLRLNHENGYTTELTWPMPGGPVQD